ncbi:GNAT family N-acetyltransferase [Dermabacteraceae bacterium P13088]
MAREGTSEWPVVVETDRLRIRPPAEHDRETNIRLHTDPHTRLYMGGALEHASLQALKLSPLGLTWGQWIICDKQSDEMLGSLTLSYDRGELELSYALLPENEGRGYAAEACQHMLAWAARELEDERIIAITQSHNKRSVHLLKRLGFEVRKGLEEFGKQQFLMERPLQPSAPRPASAHSPE